MVNHPYTVISSLYMGKTFRFCISPDPVKQFPDSSLIAPGLPSEKLTIHKDPLGMLMAKKRNLKFVFDPPTGNFRLFDSRGEIISGIAGTGKYESPFVFIRIQKNDMLYGFGASAAGLDRNRCDLILANSDTGGGSIQGRSHASFPFFLIKRGGQFFAVFLATTIPVTVHTSTSSRNPDGPGVRFRIAAPSDVDVFVFSGTLPEILDHYTRLTGRPQQLPLWALGYHLAGKVGQSQERLLAAAETIRETQIPCDAVHLDRSAMHRWRNFEWDLSRFPDPVELHRRLASIAIRTVVMTRPLIPVDNAFEPYRVGIEKGLFCIASENSNWIGKSKKGDVVLPDFTLLECRRWWEKLHAGVFNAGVSGIWNSENEPLLPSKHKGSNRFPVEEKIFDHDGNHIRLQNRYALLEAETTACAFQSFRPTERYFILSRAGSPGIQQYAISYTGENRIQWEDLRRNLHDILNLGLSGQPFAGGDTGGFLAQKGIKGLRSLIRDGDLYLRWMELGSLMPFFRTRTERWLPEREAWSWGEETLRLIKKQIQRRYRLLHYLYNLSFHAHRTGAPIVRPVFYEFPDVDPDRFKNQFCVGPALLAVPVLEPSAKSVQCHLPDGLWYEYESGKIFNGNGSYTLDVSPGYYPLFIRGGSILPVNAVRQNAEESIRSGLTVEIYPDQKMETKIRLDDGASLNEENYFEISFSAKRERNRNIQMDVSVVKHNYLPGIDIFRVRLPSGYRSMVFNGKRTEPLEEELLHEGRSLSVSTFALPLKSLHVEFEFRGGLEEMQ